MSLIPRQKGPIWIDVSVYQRVNFDALKGHVDGVIARCTIGESRVDPTFLPVVKECHKRDIPVEAYHAFDPAGNVAKQFENIRRTVEGTGVYGIWNDVERHLDWRGVTLPGSTISTRAYLLMTYLSTLNIRSGVYTAPWFVNSYSPHMKTWLKNYPLWIVDWPYPKHPTVVTTWENFKANIVPIATRKPVNLLGSSTWTFWQFSGDKHILPGILTDRGVNRTGDFNYFNGTMEQYKKSVGYKAVVVPPVVAPPVVPKIVYPVFGKVVSAVNLRADANISAKILGNIPAKLNVQIDDIKTVGANKWGKVGDGIWAAIVNNGKTYIKI